MADQRPQSRFSSNLIRPVPVHGMIPPAPGLTAGVLAGYLAGKPAAAAFRRDTPGRADVFEYRCRPLYDERRGL
jgi:hypothetical protein